MKKIILSIASLVVSGSMSMAQFVETTNSVTFNGHAVPTGSANFFGYQPDAGATVGSTDIACTVPATEELGGFDPNIYDATTVVPARTDGVIFYGGSIATRYKGDPCTASSPAFVVNLTGVDLTLAAHQKVQFDYQSNLSMNLEFQLKDQYGNPMLSTVPVVINGDGLVHTFSFDFSANVLDEANLGAIRKIELIYPSTALSGTFGFSIAKIKLGSVLTTGINDSEGILATANLFPNPSTGLTTITAELPSSSAVKVSLMDMYGRELKVITEGNFNTINTTFDVSDLAKGVYTVNYVVNGKATKVQKLVVR